MILYSYDTENDQFSGVKKKAKYPVVYSALAKLLIVVNNNEREKGF